MEENSMDSIIFDVDGTLWDSTENVAKAWSDCIQQDLGLSMEITAAKKKQKRPSIMFTKTVIM